MSLRRSFTPSRRIKLWDLMGGVLNFSYVFYELVGRDLLRVVEESKTVACIHPPLNSTFIALIPKTNNPSYFEEFRTISLCNCLYKIISKIIARHLKTVLLRIISFEQFGFREGRQIHEAISVAWEGLHSMKTRNI